MVKMQNSSVLIARHIHHITLNPFEYVLDKDGKAIRFKTVADARKFLKRHGYKKFAGIKFIRERDEV